MQIAPQLQHRLGAMLAPGAMVALLTGYCQLWAALEGGVPLRVSLVWASINTASLALFAYPLWISRGTLLAWIEDAHPANLVAAAGVMFGAAFCSVMVSTMVTATLIGGDLEFDHLIRRLLSLLPFLAATAVAVTAVLAAVRWRSSSPATVTAAQERQPAWIDFPEEPLLRLRPGDLTVIRTARNYCELGVAGRQILVRITAKQLEQRLAPHGFARVNRGAIVNLSRVRVMQRGGAGRLRLLLDDGSTVQVTKGYRELFESRLENRQRSQFQGQLAA